MSSKAADSGVTWRLLHMKADEFRRSLILWIAITLTLGLLASGDIPALGQNAPERFWLAGRYDGNRIIIYFDAVQFGDTFPKDAVRMAYPIADSFFSPAGIPPEYVARFQGRPQSEHFSLGDRYDLLLGESGTTSVTLTTLVGFASDEQVGNDSFIGALAIADNPDRLLFTRDYYVVRRHVELPANTPQPKYDPKAPVVRLDPDPVPFDIESKAVALMTDRMEGASDLGDLKQKAEQISPTVSVQRFTVADGTTRYFVWADWRTENGLAHDSFVRLGAWMSPLPALHLLAEEPPGTADGVQRESVLNVVDLGNGRTGIIVFLEGEDSRGIQLMEYKDGAAVKEMPVLQTISFGE
jgi:hypothetical protein